MKVLQLCTSDTGGAGKAALRIHQELLAFNVDSTLMVYDKKSSNYPKVVKFKPIIKGVKNKLIQKFTRILGEFITIPWHKKYNLNYITQNSKVTEVYSMPWSFHDIEYSSEFINADIIHLHWISSFVDVSIFKKFPKKIFIWTLHDMNAFTAGCHYSNNCFNFRESCHPCPMLNEDKYSDMFFDYKKSNFKGIKNLIIVSPSSWLKSLSLSSSLLKNYEHHHIPNCINPNEFKIINKKEARKILGLPLDKDIFLFSAHDSKNPRKGLDKIIEMTERLKNHNILFLVLGLLPNIKNEKILNLGFFSDSLSINLCYSASDAFLLPSLEDNLPNVIIESFYCGTPVIAFANGGIPELIINEFNGILVKENNADSLMNECLKFTAKKEMFMADEIRKSALNNYSPKEIIPKYINLYQKKLSLFIN